MNSIKALLKYAGLADIGDDVEWIYSFVMETHQTVIRTNKAALKSQGTLFVVVIISVVLVYIQTLERVNFIKPFPNCKLSFGGFPIEDGNSGIKYLCCIVNKMKKPDYPFNSVVKMKIEDLESNVHSVITRFLITNIEIEDKLKERRKNKRVEDISQYTPWTLFLPRLKPFVPFEFVDDGRSEKDKMYCLSFEIQHKINRFVSRQPPILINHDQLPYLVNTCCNEDNDTYHYFMKKDPTIVDALRKIFELSQLNKRRESNLKHPIMYSYLNTKKVSIPISTELNEITLFTGLIKLFNFDNGLPIPFTLSKFDIQKPDTDYYNKNDSIDLKIRKLKEHGYDIIDDLTKDALEEGFEIDVSIFVGSISLSNVDDSDV
jgi:hypothetical protein